MKYLLYSDVHFCETSSIVNAKGIKHSIRLDNLIASLNWAEHQAEKNNCDEIICLGDFFDKIQLNSKEITALRDVEWSSLPHKMLVGNHEGLGANLFYNATNIFRIFTNSNYEIIDKPCIEITDEAELIFIPYLSEIIRDKRELSDILVDFQKSGKKRIILSHNDIKGIRYGAIESKDGFAIEDIEKSCDLFLNGHIHNTSKICKNGFNLGNLTGQNFSEDAEIYPHNIYILDTCNNSLEAIENPYALNFYKIDLSSIKDMKIFNELKDNSVLSIKCLDKLKPELDTTIANLEAEHKVVAKRITVYTDEKIESIEISDLAATNHLTEFYNFCIDKLGSEKLVVEELSNLVKE